MAETALKAPDGYTLHEGSGLFVPVELRADALSDLTSPTAWLVDWSYGGGRATSGVPVSPQTSMAISTYYACIRAIAEDCGKLQLQTLERLARGKRQACEHPLWSILHDRFNQDMTAMSARETITHHALGWGNGYGLISRDRSMRRSKEGSVTGIYPIHPSRVRPYRNLDTGLIEYHIFHQRYALGNPNLPLIAPAEDMLHVKGLGPDGIIGYSVCALAAESLGISLATQEYGASFFGNSARPSGILSHPGQLRDEARQHLKQSWQESHGGPGRSQGTAVLEEGVTWTPISLPPEQAQWLGTRQFQIFEVCRWFRMPPSKIQDFTHAHFNNVEQQNIDYAVDTLTPWLVRWEQELVKKLFWGTDYYAKHDMRALLRGAVKDRANYYRMMFSIAALSPNDIRGLEDLDPYQGGDERFLQIQYAPVSQVALGAQGRIKRVQRELAPLEQVPDTPESEEEDTSEALWQQRNGHSNGVQHD